MNNIIILKKIKSQWLFNNKKIEPYNYGKNKRIKKEMSNANDGEVINIL